MKAKLENFLRATNSYSQYMFNIENGYWNTLSDVVDHSITEEDAHSVITNSFDWSKTKEGSVYWENIHNKWVKYLVTKNF